MQQSLSLNIREDAPGWRISATMNLMGLTEIVIAVVLVVLLVGLTLLMNPPSSWIK